MHDAAAEVGHDDDAEVEHLVAAEVGQGAAATDGIKQDDMVWVVQYLAV